MDSEDGSDTGFGSEDSSDDEVVEDLEEKGQKRQHSDDDDEENQTSGPSGKKKRKLRKENRLQKLHRPPTADELNRLRETQNLFHSNLFRLQVEEMLKEIQMKQKYKNELETWFNKFQEWILKMEDSDDQYKLCDQEWLKSYKIKIPIPQVPYQVKGVYQFKKPARVEIIGSYSTGTYLGPKVTVDVLVEMPESFFQGTDHLNTQYHRKKALYMCDLIHHIQFLQELVDEIHFVVEEGDNLNPKIEIIPSRKLGKTVTVLVHLAPQAGKFKLNRFSPIKNNVRKKWFFKDEVPLDENCPTPFYNSTILNDVTSYENHKVLADTLSIHKNIKEGVILLKVWLRQRELDIGFGGFNGFMVSMLVLYLLRIKKLSKLMSSYQVVRNVCNYLSTADWTTNGITLCEVTGDENLPTLTQFHESSSVVFVDVTGYHNICYGMSATMFRCLKQEAVFALRSLDNPDINSFLILFMTPIPFYRHYDNVIWFHNSEALENVSEIYSPKEAQLKHCGIILPQFRDIIVNTLTRGLGERAQLYIKQSGKIRWKPQKKPRQVHTLTVGLKLDPNHCFSVVDKAAEAETEEFRKFWGNRSELRRFKDGSITEAVVWSAQNIAERRLICKQIVDYLMKSKFNLQNSDFEYYADQLDRFILSDVEGQTLQVLDTFDSLSKQLRDLKDLPLEIVSVQGTSPAFRYTEVFPPIPARPRINSFEKDKGNNCSNRETIEPNRGKCPTWFSSLDVVMQLGLSKKWPQDLDAIKRIRAAFNVKIAESLNSQYGITCQAFQNGIELVKDGYIFRLIIFYPNEIGFMKQTIDADGLIKYRDTEQSLSLEKKLIHLPKLSGALHGVYQEHSSFGPACCLVKRWVCSHLIDSSHVSEETLELLVAALYLIPGPHEPPQQPQVAFFRFHHLMANTNWNAEFLVLNINNELNSQDILEIETSFHAQRSTLPAVFIATPYDRMKSLWTKDSPTPLILLRLVQLSAGVLQRFESQVYTKQFLQDEVIFQPSLEVFDVLIYLSPAYNPRLPRAVNLNSFNRKDFVGKIPINGFDPVACYLKELREDFDDVALFFHDTYGGPVIAVLWKPNIFDPREFKIANFAGRNYNHDTGKLEFRKATLIDHFFHIGKGLVRSFQVKENGAFTEYSPFHK